MSSKAIRALLPAVRRRRIPLSIRNASFVKSPQPGQAPSSTLAVEPSMVRGQPFEHNTHHNSAGSYHQLLNLI